MKKTVNARRQQFGLTLVVNHACNLRCSYCYTGAKFSAPMPTLIGSAAIARALRTLRPQGLLDLKFFGGEPLLESERILDWMAHARAEACHSEKSAWFHMTTNGTITHRWAWELMMAQDLDLAVSFDGCPRIHDRHRVDIQGRGSAGLVEATLRQLIKSRKPPRVITVVRPDNLDELSNGLTYLRGLGITEVNLSLDLWAAWNAADVCRLEQMVQDTADLWRSWLPGFSVNWFDAKTAELARLPLTETNSRCGFGDGEIAVAPSGRLYPCERLIGEDRPGHPLCLPGHVLQGEDFTDYAPPSIRKCRACQHCVLATTCDTNCRCSNYIRTGDPDRPDGLLCRLNQAVSRAVSRVLDPALPGIHLHDRNQRKCYAE